MERLKRVIVGKNRWEVLVPTINFIEDNRLSNSNAALDGVKSMLESVAKTILEDRGISYGTNPNIGYLVKLAFGSLPVFLNVTQKDKDNAKSILSSLENITRIIGEFRNDYGFFSHGQDLQADNFDNYMVELAIGSSDLLVSFLIFSHDEDLKDRKRMYYEENGEFNLYIDDTETSPEVKGFPLNPSKSLYSDSVAYKEAFLEFVNLKEDLIQRLEKSDKYVITRATCLELISLQDYLTEDEIRRLARAASDNLDIYQILGHGYTKSFFMWILNEKSNYLSSKELENLKIAFTKKIY